MTLEKAKRHAWLGRHVVELEEVYGRAVGGWYQRRRSTRPVEEEESTRVPVQRVARGESSFTPSVFGFEPGSSLARLERAGGVAVEEEGEEEEEEEEMSDVPELLFAGSPGQQQLNQGSESVADDTQDEEEEWRGGALYTAEEDELHDAAAGDGRLRSAMELAREVEARRVERVMGRELRQGGEDCGEGGGVRSRFFK